MGVRKLEIGPGRWPRGSYDWELFDLNQWDECSSYIQHAGNASDLSRFNDNTFIEVYASQVLEHFSHLETKKVVQEWWRIVAPGGTLKIEVPNFEGIYGDYWEDLNTWDEFVERLYGGQDYKGNTHYTIFTERIFIEQLYRWLSNITIEVYETYAAKGGLRVVCRKTI